MRKMDSQRTFDAGVNERNSMKAVILFISMFLVVCGCSVVEQSDVPTSDMAGIEADFLNPPAGTRPGCYWYWINDDISKEGITKDLEAMKEVGIGAAFIGNINPKGVDGPVPLFSDEWWECMVHAVNEGKRMGVDIGMFNCPGWSMSGGPWVKSEMAMRHMVYSETYVKGPGKVQHMLKQARKEFQDTHVLAFPTVQAGKTKLTNKNSKVRITPQIDNASAIAIGTLCFLTALSATPNPIKKVEVAGVLLCRIAYILSGVEEFFYLSCGFESSLFWLICHLITNEEATLIAHGNKGGQHELALEYAHVIYFPNISLETIYDKFNQASQAKQKEY